MPWTVKSLLLNIHAHKTKTNFSTSLHIEIKKTVTLCKKITLVQQIKKFSVGDHSLGTLLEGSIYRARGRLPSKVHFLYLLLFHFDKVKWCFCYFLVLCGYWVIQSALLLNCSTLDWKSLRVLITSTVGFYIICAEHELSPGFLCQTILTFILARLPPTA